MMIKRITITCPNCKNNFDDSIVISCNASVSKDNAIFKSTRECPSCKNLVDITDNDNWIDTPEPPRNTLKDWFQKFLP